MIANSSDSNSSNEKKPRPNIHLKLDRLTCNVQASAHERLISARSFHKTPGQVVERRPDSDSVRLTNQESCESVPNLLGQLRQRSRKRINTTKVADGKRRKFQKPSRATSSFYVPNTNIYSHTQTSETPLEDASSLPRSPFIRRGAYHTSDTESLTRTEKMNQLQEKIIDNTIGTRIVRNRKFKAATAGDEKEEWLRFEREVKLGLHRQGLLGEDIEIPPSPTFTGIDKYGKPKDPILETAKKKMIRPRNNLNKEEGQLSLNEEKVFSILERIGHHYEPEEKARFDLDSLLESAFDDEKNEEWAQYKEPFQVPMASEESLEQIKLCNADPRDDVSIGHDQFSDKNESGSSLSSGYSFNLQEFDISDKINMLSPFRAQKVAEENRKKDKREVKRTLEGSFKVGKYDGTFNSSDKLGKYTFFKIIQGLKIPTSQGPQKLSVGAIISISQFMIAVSQRKNKFSRQMVQTILELYQKDFGAPPLDLSRAFQVRGQLILENFRISVQQQRAVAATIPYILNLQRINLENCGFADQEVAYVLQAASKLSKIEMIKLGQNQIGKLAVDQLDKNKRFQTRVQDFGIQFMKHSAGYISLFLKKMFDFKNLKFLNLSGNVLSPESAENLAKKLGNTYCLEFLNISSGCFKSLMALRYVTDGLLQNTTLRYLNLSNNKVTDFDYEFASRLGRVIIAHPQLLHLDISFCWLSLPELIYIAFCSKESQQLSAIHLGYNNCDYQGRLILRQILQASVKYPFRSSIQLIEKISLNSREYAQTGKQTKVTTKKNAHDKWMMVVLNGFVMSSLPPAIDGAMAQKQKHQATPGEFQGRAQTKINQMIVNKSILSRPLQSMRDVRKRIYEYMKLKEEVKKNPSAMANMVSDQDAAKNRNMEVKRIITDAAKIQKEVDLDRMIQNKSHGIYANTQGLLSKIANLLQEPNFEKKSLKTQLQKAFLLQMKQNIQKDLLTSKNKVVKRDPSGTSIAIGDIRSKQVAQGKEWLERYFGDSSARIYDMLHFFDFYGRKNNLISNQEVQKTHRQIMEEMNIKYGKKKTPKKEIVLKPQARKLRKSFAGQVQLKSADMWRRARAESRTSSMFADSGGSPVKGRRMTILNQLELVQQIIHETEESEKYFIKTAEQLKEEGYILWKADGDLEKSQTSEEKRQQANEEVANTREQKQIEQLKKIIRAKGFQDSEMVMNLKSIFKWALLFNDLDVHEASRGDGDGEYTPYRGGQDFVFQRYINHPDIENGTQWQDTSECWLCSHHQKVTIEITEQQVLEDKEFVELFTLTSIINDQDNAIKADQIFNDSIKDGLKKFGHFNLGIDQAGDKGDPKKVVVTQNLLPVFEDVYELISDKESEMKRRRTTETSSEERSSAMKPTDSGKVDFFKSFSGSQGSAKKKTIGELVEVKPKENRNFFDFHRTYKGRNLVKLRTTQGPASPSFFGLQTNVNDEVRMAVHHDLMLYHSNISATPIRLRQLVKQVCPTAEFDGSKIEKYNIYAEEDNKKLVRDNCVFKHFKLGAADDTRMSIESDSSSDDFRRKKNAVTVTRTEEETSLDQLQADSRSFEEDSLVEIKNSRGGTTIMRKVTLKKPKPRAVSVGFNRRPTIKRGSQRPVSQVQLQTPTHSNLIHRRQISARKLDSKAGRTEKKNASKKSSNQVVPFIFPTKDGGLRIPEKKLNAQEEKETQLFRESKIKLVGDSLQSSHIEDSTQVGSVGNEASSKIIQAVITSREQTPKRKPSSGVKLFKPLCAEDRVQTEDFKNVNQVRKDMKVEAKAKKKRMMTALKDKILEKVHDKLEEIQNPPKLPADLMIEKIKESWFSLKKQAEVEGGGPTVYLVASFNNWFPIKMRNLKQLKSDREFMKRESFMIKSHVGSINDENKSTPEDPTDKANAVVGSNLSQFQMARVKFEMAPSDTTQSPKASFRAIESPAFGQHGSSFDGQSVSGKRKSAFTPGFSIQASQKNLLLSLPGGEETKPPPRGRSSAAHAFQATGGLVKLQEMFNPILKKGQDHITSPPTKKTTTDLPLFSIKENQKENITPQGQTKSTSPFSKYTLRLNNNETKVGSKNNSNTTTTKSKTRAVNFADTDFKKAKIAAPKSQPKTQAPQKKSLKDQRFQQMAKRRQSMVINWKASRVMPEFRERDSFKLQAKKEEKENLKLKLQKQTFSLATPMESPNSKDRSLQSSPLKAKPSQAKSQSNSPHKFHRSNQLTKEQFEDIERKEILGGFAVKLREQFKARKNSLMSLHLGARSRMDLESQASTSRTRTVFKFVEFVPVGKHYFYFVKNGTHFTVSKRYPVEAFPGSNIRMNTLVLNEGKELNFDQDVEEEQNLDSLISDTTPTPKANKKGLGGGLKRQDNVMHKIRNQQDSASPFTRGNRGKTISVSDDDSSSVSSQSLEDKTPVEGKGLGWANRDLFG